MGNQHSHDQKDSGGEQSGSGTSLSRAGSRRSTVPRSGSGGDLQEKQEKTPPMSLVPVEKLAKVITLF